MDERGPAAVLLARFEDLIGAGVRSLIAEDPSLRLVAADVPLSELPAAIAEHAPRVALANLARCAPPARSGA